MTQKTINVVMGLAVAALVVVSLMTYFTRSYGTAMYERTKWVGEYFSVGTTEQFHVDESGNVTTTGTIASTGDMTVGDDLIVTSTEYTIGGIRYTEVRQEMASATTTVCALASPNATSTLVNATADFTVSSTTASRVTIAKATTPYATTTQIGQTIAISANAQDTILASTTAAQIGAEVAIFAPNAYTVVSMAGGVGTFSPTGTCTATYRDVD
jgi:hypothetical protein